MGCRKAARFLPAFRQVEPLSRPGFVEIDRSTTNFLPQPQKVLQSPPNGENT